MARKKKGGSALSHAEIWDDSALVQSWDDAVEEYKAYHSIHARGEDVEKVLKQAEEEEAEEEQGEPMDAESSAVDESKSSSDQAVLPEAQVSWI